MQHPTYSIRRRAFLRGGAMALAATALPLVLSRPRLARAHYGELVPDPNGLFDLPPGFSYTIVDRAGDPMTDGYRVPGAPDAMGAFPGPNGTILLMRNHELTDDDGPYSNGQDPPPEAYDPDAVGGVTRVVLDAETLEVVSRNLVLVGTLRNCAGGVSPWGWLSCEETTDDGHGYTFLCPTDADSVAPPQRITGYGRCNHEAACVDPDTLCAYLTEDRIDSCLYRFVPADKADPFTGKLQALRVVGADNFATTGMHVQDVVDCAWVDLDDPDPVGDTLRAEAQAKGAAIFIRGEGIWFTAGVIHVCATSGGPAWSGQIFKLVDDPGGATLELIAQSDDTDTLDMPDNICVAPWGDLFMAEDGKNDNYVRVLTPAGELLDFGRTGVSQLAGVCFSPDGRTMFLNLQDVDTTIAVRGPFPIEDEPETTTGDDAGSDASSGESSTSAGDETTGAVDETTGAGASSDESSAAATAAAESSGDESSSGASTTADGDATGAPGEAGPELDGAEAGGCGCAATGSSPRGLLLAAASVVVMRGVTRGSSVDPSAEARARLEHEGVTAAGLQTGRGRQPGGSGPDDDRVGVHGEESIAMSG